MTSEVRHAFGPRVPSSASELRRSRRGDRVLRPAVPDLEEGELGRPAGARLPERRPDPVHPGRRCAGDVTADRDLALRLHVTDTRASLESYRRRPDVRLLPLYTTDEGGSVFISSDTWPGTGGTPGLTNAQIASVRASGVQPVRTGGFGYMEGPDEALLEYAGNHPAERFNHVHLFQDDPFCARLWYQKHLNAPVFAGRTSRTPLTEATCKVERGPERSWPALERQGMFRSPSAAVVFGDVALPWYMRQGDRPLAGTRGHLYDHIALSVGDLDGWIAKLRGEGVTFLDEPYALGDTRAVMIEGPSREALELVEVR